jgi:hypothetical protein
MLTCPVCHRLFDKRSDAIYCGASCRARAWRLREDGVVRDLAAFRAEIQLLLARYAETIDEATLRALPAEARAFRPDVGRRAA